MRGAIVLLFIALGLAGCKSDVPTADPFSNHPIVPPPPTGSCPLPQTDPGYAPNTLPTQAQPAKAGFPVNTSGSAGSRSTACKLSQSKFDSLGQQRQWMVRSPCDGPTTALTRHDLSAVRYKPRQSRDEFGPDRFERLAAAKSLFRDPANLRRIGKRTGNGSSFGNSGFKHIDTQSHSAARHSTAWRISDFAD